MSDKLPAFQFYPGDWRKDPGIQACSFAARGLWVEMLCLMHESEQRGYLVLAGRAITPEQLARQTGGSADEVRGLLAELETAGVFSRDENGVIFSRRMGRDEHIRRVRSEAGKLGAVHGHKGGRPRKDGDEKRQKGQTERQSNPPGVSEGVAVSACDERGQAQNPLAGGFEGGENGKKRQTERQTEGQTERQNNPPSSSSSSSEYIPAVAGVCEDAPKPKKGGKRDPETDPLFIRFWAAYPRKKKRPEAARAFAKARKAELIREDNIGGILAAIERQRDSRDWLKDGGQYIPYPASWLNSREWEDCNDAPAPEPPRIKLAAHNPLVDDDFDYKPLEN